MRKRAFVTGGMIALILILGSSTAFAANLQLNPSEIALIKSEISSGKPIKDVLDEHHITMGQIRNALGMALNKGGKLSNTQIAMIATRLGLDASQIQSEIASGKTLIQVLKDHNITDAQLQTVFKTTSGLGQNIKRVAKTSKKTREKDTASG